MRRLIVVPCFGDIAYLFCAEIAARAVRELGKFQEGTIFAITDQPPLCVPDDLGQLATVCHVPKQVGNVFRSKLAMAEYVPWQDFDSILWMDCDILAIRDIHELFAEDEHLHYSEEFSSPMDDPRFNACSPPSVIREHMQYRPGINSGLFSIRADRFQSAMKAWRDRFDECGCREDQPSFNDIIVTNMIAAKPYPDKWIEFPRIYSWYNPDLMTRINSSTRMLHYCGAPTKAETLYLMESGLETILSIAHKPFKGGQVYVNGKRESHGRTVFDALVARDVEVYQDIWVIDKPVVNGIRESAERYQILSDYIANGSTILDIGSCYGYFSLRLANEKQCVAWSFEPDPIRQEIQREAIIANNQLNVYLSGERLTWDSMKRLSSAVETVETILALSVSHYWKSSETGHIIEMLANYSPNLIIELAQSTERIVANKLEIDSQFTLHHLQKHYGKVVRIGEVKSSKDPDVMRPIYHCSNDNIQRTGFSYIGGESARTHTVSYEDGWRIDNRPVSPGLNIHNVVTTKLIYPTVEQVIDLGVETYDALKSARNGNITDIRTWNLIATPDGLKPIDYEEDETSFTPSNELFSDYRQRVKKMSKADLWQELGRSLAVGMLGSEV